MAIKTSQPKTCDRNTAFTLRELLVLIVALTLLAGLYVTAARGAASRRTKVAQCAANLRQFAVTTHLYANENRDRLPEITGGAWAWDLPNAPANSLLTYGMTRRIFYCPGTAPRFNDKFNFLNASPNSLWNFSPTFHVIGYLAAFNGANLILSNQNLTILPEQPRINSSTFHPVPPNHERVLLADATISENLAGTPATPAPAGSFTSVAGGFSVNGTFVPHISPHLKGALPAGGNLAFKDGHVDWRPFLEMRQRASSGRGFWW